MGIAVRRLAIAAIPSLILLWELIAIWRGAELGKMFLLPILKLTWETLASILGRPPHIAVVSLIVTLAAFLAMLLAFLRLWRAAKRLINRHLRNRPESARS